MSTHPDHRINHNFETMHRFDLIFFTRFRPVWVSSRVLNGMKEREGEKTEAQWRGSVFAVSHAPAIGPVSLRLCPYCPPPGCLCLILLLSLLPRKRRFARTERISRVAGTGNRGSEPEPATTVPNCTGTGRLFWYRPYWGPPFETVELEADLNADPTDEMLRSFRRDAPEFSKAVTI